jgi:hypothetical protein
MYFWKELGRYIPAGRTTFDKSHSESVFLNSSYITAGSSVRSCLGMSAAIESTVWVGAAKRVVGARAKTRLRVVVKIMFAYRIVLSQR